MIPAMARSQFGGMDTKDDRREIMILLQRLGDGVPKPIGDERRAAFLKDMLAFSENGFDEVQASIQPCDPGAAYFVFVNICGVLGVPIDWAARRLEDEVRRKR